MHAGPRPRPAPEARPRGPAGLHRPVPGASREYPPSPAPRDSPHEPVPRASRLPLAALAALLACGPPPDLPGPAAAAAAADLWQTRCANCHGVTGRGDGPSGRALVQRPRDFHDAAWQTRVTDDHLRRTIIEGGHSVGLSPDMAANTDLAERPAVVDELVKIVRSFAAP